MQKGPLAAVAIAAIALIGIYLFTDIKQAKTTKVAENTTAIVQAGNEYIQSFLNSLDQSKRELASALYQRVEDQDTTAVDELIRFYEDVQQYNFAAYMHSLKAELSPSRANWELAGDRQLSVSSNEAYDNDFNEVLYQEALSSYQKAIDLDSNNLDLQVKLGSAIVDRSPQPMQGISLLLGVIEKDSFHINGNLALGKFGIISGQYDKAIIRLEKVLSLQPQNTEALFLSAEAYSNLGNTDKAIEALNFCKDLVENEDLKKEIDAYLQQLL